MMNRRAAGTLLALWGLLLLALCLVLVFAPAGLAGSATAGAENFSRLFQLSWNTIRVAGGAGFIAVLWAILPALTAARLERSWTRTLLIAIASAPLFIAPQVIAVASVRLLGAQGAITRLFYEGIHLFPPEELISGASTQRAAPIYSLAGTMAVMAWAFAPLAFLALTAALRRTDPSAEEAARLDTTPARALFRLTLPMSNGGIVAGAALVLLITATNFGIPDSLRSQPVLVNEVFVSFGVYYDTQRALRTALLLAAVALAGAWVLFAAIRSLGLQEASDSQEVELPTRFPKTYGILLVRISGWLFAVVPVLVLVCILWSTATGEQGRFELMRHTWELVGEDLLMSLKLSAWGAVICGVTGAALGSALASMRRPLVWRLLLLFGFVLPGPVSGVALRTVASLPRDSLPFNLDDHLASAGDTIGMLLLAWAVRFVPITALLIEYALRRLPNEYHEVARLEGARWWSNLKAYGWRAIMPPACAGMIATYALTLGELGAALLLIPPGPTTLSVRLQTLMHYAPTGQVSTICLMLLLPGLGMLGLMVVVSLVLRKKT